MKNYAPMLAPNDKIDLATIQYPQLLSLKIDGIRCLFKAGEMLSRSLKQIPNIKLHEKYCGLKEWSLEHPNIVLDGELYAPDLTFQQITSVVMSDNKEVPESLEFCMFDCVDLSNPDEPFSERCKFDKIDLKEVQAFYIVAQIWVHTPENISVEFKKALDSGYEGLILKNPSGRYKYGRATVKENLCYKVKPFVEKSAIIKDVQQATVAREGSEKKINELGQSKTSMKKDDRVPIERAAAFIVDWNGRELAVTIAATNEEKDKIWANRAEYVGKEVCFKAMDVGAKDLPRHPVATRWWLHDE
jgi:ATP-dependent DNA ligase